MFLMPFARSRGGPARRARWRAGAAVALCTGLALAGCKSVRSDAPLSDGSRIDPPRDASRGLARTCLTENARFPEAWACVRGKLASGSGASPDPRLAGFLAKGDRLAAEVDAGEMSNVEARNEASADLRRDLGE